MALQAITAAHIKMRCIFRVGDRIVFEATLIAGAGEMFAFHSI